MIKSPGHPEVKQEDPESPARYSTLQETISSCLLSSLPGEQRAVRRQTLPSRDLPSSPSPASVTQAPERVQQERGQKDALTQVVREEMVR